MVQVLERMESRYTEQFQTDHRPRVLLIEDSHDLQTIIQLGLELMLGVQVITGQTTDNWMGLIQYHQPDVIVLELFAEQNAVLGTLKNNPSLCHIPVVGLVVRDRPQDLLNAQAQGISAIVSKPFDLDTLQDIIFKMLVR